MGEFLAALAVILLSLGITGLGAAAARPWLLRVAGFPVILLAGAGVISVLALGMGAAIAAPLPSQIAELIFFLCAAQMLVPLGVLVAVYRDYRKLEINRLVAADL